MVLANALYFKGRWKERFEKEVTQPAAFRRGGEHHERPAPTARIPAERHAGTARMNGGGAA
jgi:serine protease inhibitor